MKKIATALIGLTICASAHAEFWTGNDLHQRLNSSNLVDKGLALGYVMGVFDATFTAVHCAPDTVNAGQINDLAKTLLNSYPAIRNRTADQILSEIFKAAWPCQNQGRSL